MLWISQAQRWRGLNLTIRMPGPIKEFLHIPAHYLCNLENASLDFINWESEDIQCIWDAVHTSPNLREIHWNSPSVKRPPLTVLHHVTSLSVWRFSLEELATLSSLTQLVNLEVTSFKDSLDKMMIKLPALESLSVRFLKKDSTWLFDQITTPNLRHLRVGQCVEIIDVSALHRFLKRNKCSLQRLHLHMSQSPEASVLQYVQIAASLLTNLKSFTLEFWEITEMTVRELVPRAGDTQVFLPHLEELSLLGCRLEDGLIGRMVAARYSLGKPLGAIRVRYSGRERPHSLDGAILNRLKETGVLTRLKCDAANNSARREFVITAM
ncbi:hypothetical protein BDN72DRAFT_149520 [Pluteus cervinus]|uniref:Uncharacterized protein n=1 Tax=Pluteus cervinus TaxID=181527 RepID=A0ACD2ZXG8_9AGAR|nr:hypothetical protein BDN72DRAFT_149520 [Pluteus cervinus]